ncbi:MAG: S8 family serine peptidase [candidate division Zixibacteria bacterium]|nr:S8 family serine peptidase [candidate division Zixibacteria bacterium]
MKNFLTAMLVLLVLISGTAFGSEDFQVKEMNVKSGADFVEGNIVVKFKPHADNRSIEAFTKGHGCNVLSASPRGGFKTLGIPAAKTVPQMVAAFKANPNVEYAEPNYIYRALFTPNDPYYSYQWHMPMINMGQAWDLSTGTGVIVAVVDGGVAYEDYGVYAQAPDLAQTTFVQGYDFINNDSHPNDDNAHGTHVAGTIAQSTNNNLGVTGIAFNCSIMPVKVLDASGSGTMDVVANGIYYAADNGADVINMSLGSTYLSTTVHDACIYAYNMGVTIVCAAGNSGRRVLEYPAAFSECISVSAVRLDSTLVGYSTYNSEVDIAAPGGDVNVDQDGDGYVDGVLQQTHDGSDYTTFSYYFYQGTSMASPHVAGVAAGIIALDGSLTPAEVQTILQNSAVDLGSTGWDEEYGWGMLDAYAAYQAVGSSNDPPVAGFSGSPTSGETPVTVEFTDLSTNSPTSWAWTFGDGGTSSAQNPSYNYTTAGTYTVTLTATNAYGSDDEVKVDYITVTAPVNNPPVADFSGSPTSGGVSLNVSFTDLSTENPTSWSWTFGDGGTSTAQNPSYTYNTVGTYTVTLTATNAYGSDDEVKVDYITVTEPDPFSNAYALSDIPVAGTVSGNYTNTQSSDNSYESITESESVGKPDNRYSYLEHKWDFSIPSSSALTFYMEGYRSDNSDGDNFTFAYSTDNVNFTDLVTVNSATEQVYSASIPSSVSGTVYIRVVDTDQSTGARSLDAVFIDEMYIQYSSEPIAPVADFSGTPTAGSYPLLVSFTDLSTGAPTSWSWTFGDGGTSTAQNPTYTYNTAGVYTVSMTATNAIGSDVATKTDYITVTEPTVASMYVYDIIVTRKNAGPNCNGIGTIYIYDSEGQPVANATVYATATGPVGATFSDLTDADGAITFETDKTKSCEGEWCFEVTNVTHASNTYNSAANNVTKACESGPVFKEVDGAIASLIPDSYRLHQNYPNPFNPSTEISFALPKSGFVNISVYNIMGQKVAELVNNNLTAGNHSVEWDASAMSSGIYLYRIDAEEFSDTKKMLLIK